MLSAENQKSTRSRTIEGDEVPAVHPLSRTFGAGGENIKVLLQVDRVSEFYEFKYPLPMPERILQRAGA